MSTLRSAVRPSNAGQLTDKRERALDYARLFIASENGGPALRKAEALREVSADLDREDIVKAIAEIRGCTPGAARAEFFDRVNRMVHWRVGYFDALRGQGGNARAAAIARDEGLPELMELKPLREAMEELAQQGEKVKSQLLSTQQILELASQHRPKGDAIATEIVRKYKLGEFVDFLVPRGYPALLGDYHSVE